MLSYDELPQSAQKAYKTTNILRTVTMFIGWAASILIAILFRNEDTSFVSKIIGGFMLGAAIHGIVHSEFLLKGVMNALKKFSIIGLFIGLGICCMLICLLCYAGGIFLIVDTVLFILKKPLIYPFENKCFLNTKQAQIETQEVEWDEYLQAQNSESAMATLQTLKNLLEQGVITEEEFNSKKAGLLERI